MQTIKDAFKLPVGYSDHTKGNVVGVSAVAMGASVIEKHFTLDRNMEEPDFFVSSTPDELKQLVTDIRNIESAMGDGRKQGTLTEKNF